MFSLISLSTINHRQMSMHKPDTDPTLQALDLLWSGQSEVISVTISFPSTHISPSNSIIT